MNERIQTLIPWRRKCTENQVNGLEETRTLKVNIWPMSVKIATTFVIILKQCVFSVFPLYIQLHNVQCTSGSID